MRREVLNLSSRGCFFFFFSWRTHSYGARYTAAEKLQVFVSLCKSLRGEKRKSWSSSAGSEYLRLSEVFKEEDGVSSARLPSASSPDGLQPLRGVLNQSSRVSDD